MMSKSRLTIYFPGRCISASCLRRLHGAIFIDDSPEVIDVASHDANVPDVVLFHLLTGQMILALFKMILKDEARRL